MQETWIQSLGWEDPLEKGTATHSSVLAWRFHGLYSHEESGTSDFHFQNIPIYTIIYLHYVYILGNDFYVYILGNWAIISKIKLLNGTEEKVLSFHSQKTV